MRLNLRNLVIVLKRHFLSIVLSLLIFDLVLLGLLLFINWLDSTHSKPESIVILFANEQKCLTREVEHDQKVDESAEADADDHTPSYGELHVHVWHVLSEEHKMPGHDCNAEFIEHVKFIIEREFLGLVVAGVDQDHQVQKVYRNNLD